MFDVGFAEVLLLSLVGLMVLGPERLPRVARTLGGLARKARSSWYNLKRSIEAEIRAEELKEPLKNFENEIKSTVDELKSGIDSVRETDPFMTRSADQTKSADQSDSTDTSKPADKPAEPDNAR